MSASLNANFVLETIEMFQANVLVVHGKALRLGPNRTCVCGQVNLSVGHVAQCRVALTDQRINVARGQAACVYQAKLRSRGVLSLTHAQTPPFSISEPMSSDLLKGWSKALDRGPAMTATNTVCLEEACAFVDEQEKLFIVDKPTHCGAWEVYAWMNIRACQPRDWEWVPPAEYVNSIPWLPLGWEPAYSYAVDMMRAQCFHDKRPFNIFDRAVVPHSSSWRGEVSYAKGEAVIRMGWPVVGEDSNVLDPKQWPNPEMYPVISVSMLRYLLHRDLEDVR